MEKKQFDVIMAGGGVMGCAIAYYLLKADSKIRVAIVERDPTYVKASTTLSDGNIRTQFNIKENILMSLYGLDKLATFVEEMATDEHVPDVAFRQQGNLFIIDEAGRAKAMEGIKLQRSLGCEVEWLEPEEIKKVYPLFNPVDVAGATYGLKDGTMSPLDVLLAYRRKAIAMGATVIEASVAALLKDGDTMTGIRLEDGDELQAKHIINTTGAWASKLFATIGVDVPIASTKRQVYAVETDVVVSQELPLLLMHTGQYALHEGGNKFATGGAQPDDPVTTDDFSWSKGRFEERLWEGLVKYLPKFDRLKVTQGWAGLYAVNTLDGNGIIGEWPEIKGLYLANGFSGHGFQQCHAIGRYISELILGTVPTLDLSIFSPQRIVDKVAVFENPARLI